MVLTIPLWLIATLLEGTIYKPSMTPFKHIRRFTDTMQCSKNVHEAHAFGCKEGNISLVTRLQKRHAGTTQA